MKKLIGAVCVLAAVAVAQTSNYGIPFDDLVGANWHVWCYSDDDEAAVFTARGGEFEGIRLDSGRAAINTLGVPVRVDYDPPANGIQVYVAANTPGLPATMRCLLESTGTVEYERSTMRSRPGQTSMGPETRAENRWVWCEFTNATFWQYSIRYVK